jgi:hypothetical protein
MKTPRRPAVPREQAPVPPVLAALVIALAAALAALGASFKMDDADAFQHLAVGRAIWQLHAIPRTDLWTWPGYGQPYLLPSWLYRAILWPFWSAGHEWGAMALRWLLMLGTFAFAWAAARRAGARGLAPLVVLLWCALIARQRSMLRPEMFAALLLAAEIWLLERRRGGDHRAAVWLAPLACLWINAHVSYTLFFEIGAAYLADAWWRRRDGAAPGQLALALLVSLAAVFLNPFGWAGVWQPFDFVLHQRNEPLFRAIDELQGIPWRDNLRNGLPALLALGPLLALWRWRRRFDLAQLLLYAVFYAQAFGSLRFLGPLAVVLAPFLARDLSEALAAGEWPAWTRPAAARAALVAAGCLLVAVPELTRANTRIGLGFLPAPYPATACDWIERHDVRGRAWNAFDNAGYLLWRFWPQRDRLPFMDIHQTGTRQDRDLVAFMHQDPAAWRRLDDERRFDWVLMPRAQSDRTRRVDWLDADSTFVPGFVDDDWVVYLRRDGSMAALADSAGYRRLPGSYRNMGAFGDSIVANPAVRPQVRAELERSIRESPANGHAHSLLANLDLLEGRWADALANLEAAREVQPGLPGLDARARVARDSLAAGARR